MFPRSDGCIISTFEHALQGAANESICFRVYLEASGDTLFWKVSLVEFDDFFRYNVDLMNPHKRKERYAWVAERLVVSYSPDGKPCVELKTGNSSTLEEYSLCSKEVLPSGRFTEGEFRLARESITNRVNKREKAILQRNTDSQRKFMESLKASRERARVAEAEEREAEEKRNLACEAEQEKVTRTLLLEQERMQQVETRRAGNIAALMAARATRQKEATAKQLRENLSAREAREQLVSSWKENHDSHVSMQQQEQADFEAALKRTDSLREKNIADRLKRIQTREAEYLGKRKETIQLLKRREIVRLERRREAAHRLYVPI